MKLGGADGYDARREEEKLQVRRRKRNKEDKGTTFMGYVHSVSFVLSLQALTVSNTFVISALSRSDPLNA